MHASGFFDPHDPEREYANWDEIVTELGVDRGLALVEHGNTLDLFVAGLAWISKPRQRLVYSWDPIFQTLHERGWQAVKGWLDWNGEWMYAGRLAAKAAE
jgi:hypothetical protein